MRLMIHFRHMERSEAIEALATEKVTAAVDNFVHRHDAHVEIWLISELNRTNRGTPNFKCEIEVRYPPRKSFFVSKASADMHMAVQDATDALKVLLDEAGKKEIDLRNNATPPVG